MTPGAVTAKDRWVFGIGGPLAILVSIAGAAMMVHEATQVSDISLGIALAVACLTVAIPFAIGAWLGVWSRSRYLKRLAEDPNSAIRDSSPSSSTKAAIAVSGPLVLIVVGLATAGTQTRDFVEGSILALLGSWVGGLFLALWWVTRDAHETPDPS